MSVSVLKPMPSGLVVLLLALLLGIQPITTDLYPATPRPHSTTELGAKRGQGQLRAHGAAAELWRGRNCSSARCPTACRRAHPVGAWRLRHAGGVGTCWRPPLNRLLPRAVQGAAMVRP